MREGVKRQREGGGSRSGSEVREGGQTGSEVREGSEGGRREWEWE